MIESPVDAIELGSGTLLVISLVFAANWVVGAGLAALVGSIALVRALRSSL